MEQLPFEPHFGLPRAFPGQRHGRRNPVSRRQVPAGAQACAFDLQPLLQAAVQNEPVQASRCHTEGRDVRQLERHYRVYVPWRGERAS